jgi:F5/8 type C domain
MFNDKAMFFYRSFCDFKSTGFSLALSTDYLSNTLTYAVDRDLSTAATTSGKNSDATNADFIVDLIQARIIDTVFVRSNFSTFTIYHSTNGSSWTPYQAYTGNADGFVMARAGTITARYIKVSCTATLPANQEKQLVELAITKFIDEIAINDLTDTQQVWQRISTQNLKGGSIQLVTFPQYPKISMLIGLKNMLTNWSTFESIKQEFVVDACLVYLYFSSQITPLGIGALYLMNDVADKAFPLSANTLVAGVDGELELHEA